MNKLMEGVQKLTKTSIERFKIRKLRKQIENGHWIEKDEAVKNLRKIGTDKVTSYFIRKLKSPFDSVRFKAVSALGYIADPLTVPELIKCLNDRVWDVRGETIISLGKIGSIDAIRPLIIGLSDKVSKNRSYAEESLTKIRFRLLKGKTKFSTKQPEHFALERIHPGFFPNSYLKFIEVVKKNPRKSPEYFKLEAMQLKAVEGRLK